MAKRVAPAARNGDQSNTSDRVDEFAQKIIKVLTDSDALREDEKYVCEPPSTEKRIPVDGMMVTFELDGIGRRKVFSVEVSDDLHPWVNLLDKTTYAEAPIGGSRYRSTIDLGHIELAESEEKPLYFRLVYRNDNLDSDGSGDTQFVLVKTCPAPT